MYIYIFSTESGRQIKMNDEMMVFCDVIRINPTADDYKIVGSAGQGTLSEGRMLTLCVSPGLISFRNAFFTATSSNERLNPLLWVHRQMIQSIWDCDLSRAPPAKKKEKRHSRRNSNFHHANEPDCCLPPLSLHQFITRVRDAKHQACLLTMHPQIIWRKWCRVNGLQKIMGLENNGKQDG